MDLIRKSRLFGSVRRTQILNLLALLGESFPVEIARLLDARPYSVRQIIESLEIEGVVATRKLGHERRVSLNPRYPAYKELLALLRKTAQWDDDLFKALASQRRRPRRRGKAL